MSDLYVAGTRSFAAEVADFAEAAGHRVVGLLEPYAREQIGTTIHGFPVTWLEETAAAEVVIGTGERSRREVVSRLESAGWTFVAIVHPRAHVSPRSDVGVGAVVAPGVVVGAHSSIGTHALLGRGVLVGHHTRIGAFVTLNPGANVAGNVGVGEDAFIGMAAVVRDHLAVGAGAVVAMGAVVLADVPDGAEVRGFPAAVQEPVEPAHGDTRDERTAPSSEA